MKLDVDSHLIQARREADLLLLRAERPRTVRLTSIAVAAATLFAASLAGGFAMRTADVAAVDRGNPMLDLLARQQARQQWRWSGFERPRESAVDLTLTVTD